MSLKKTTGLVAAPPTGFLEDGKVDFGVVGPLARHLHAEGVAGVFVNGTTGEGASLTVEEREELAESWQAAVPEGMRFFVHVGHNSVGEACRLAAHAERIGADAIGLMAPGFYRPVALASLVDFCAEVAAAAPSLPFYFYHMPSMNGVTLRVAAFLRAAASRIPNLAGVKFTFEAMDDFQECLAMDEGRFDVLWGRDEMLLGALATGARGAVGSTYNVAAPHYRQIVEAFEVGDLAEARELQLQAIAMINAMVATGHFFVALKSMLREQGVPISPRVRLPLANPPGRLPSLPSMKIRRPEPVLVTA